jgi:MFS family permease
MPNRTPNVAQRYVERNLLTIQVAIAVAAGLGLAIASNAPPFDRWVKTIVAEDRRDLYSAVSSVAGALLGFVMAAAAIILAAVDSPKLDRLKTSAQYRTLLRVFVSTSKWLGLLTIGSLVGIMLDRKEDPRPLIFYVLASLAVLCVLRFATCVWILERVTSVLGSDLGKGPSGAEPPSADPSISTQNPRS